MVASPEAVRMLRAYHNNLSKDDDDPDEKVLVGGLKKGSNERVSKEEKLTVGNYMTLQNIVSKNIY